MPSCLNAKLSVIGAIRCRYVYIYIYIYIYILELYIYRVEGVSETRRSQKQPGGCARSSSAARRFTPVSFGNQLQGLL